MNETTLVLAQLMGPVLLVLGGSAFLNKDMYVSWRKQLTGKNFNLVFIGVVEFVAGLSIVLNHNVWSNFTEIIVSALGWGMFLEGLMLLLLTDAYAKMAAKFLMPSLIKIAALAGVLLGAYLSWTVYM